MGRDDDRTWTELVESFHASGDADRTWPEAEDVDPAKPDHTFDSPATTTSPGLSFRPGKDAEREPAAPQAPRPEPVRADGDHFVPPTPPPIPRTDLITMLAWVGVFGSPVLFAAAYVFDIYVPAPITMLAVIGFVGGFALLISRLRGHDPYDPDNGAVV